MTGAVAFVKAHWKLIAAVVGILGLFAVIWSRGGPGLPAGLAAFLRSQAEKKVEELEREVAAKDKDLADAARRFEADRARLAASIAQREAAIRLKDSQIAALAGKLGEETRKREAIAEDLRRELARPRTATEAHRRLATAGHPGGSP